MAILAKIEGKVASISRPQNGDYIWVSVLQKDPSGRAQLTDVGMLRADDYGVSEDTSIIWTVRIDADRKEAGKLLAFYVVAR